jgi:hypothetical protein
MAGPRAPRSLTLEPEEVTMPGKVPQPPNIKKKGKSIKEKRAAKKQKAAGSS